jgi:hypothetical protein
MNFNPPEDREMAPTLAMNATAPQRAASETRATAEAPAISKTAATLHAPDRPEAPPAPAGLATIAGLAAPEALAAFGAPRAQFAAAPPPDGTEDAAEVVRSENNILRWMEYLPEDCIRTMIEMGWDVST